MHNAYDFSLPETVDTNSFTGSFPAELESVVSSFDTNRCGIGKFPFMSQEAYAERVARSSTSLFDALNTAFVIVSISAGCNPELTGTPSNCGRCS